MAARYWLQIPEIVGEASDRDHADWIDIESFSTGSRSGGVSSGQTGGTRKNLTLEDFHFTKKTDKASSKLMEAAAKGKPFPKVILRRGRSSQPLARFCQA